MSSIRPPHADPLVDAARPPLASGVRVLGRHFFAHPDRVIPFDDDGELDPITVALATDDGGRSWELIYYPLTRELYGHAPAADAVLGIAALDPNAAAELIAAVRAQELRSWEDVLGLVLRRREANLGRVIRCRVTVDVDGVGWVGPEYVVEAFARQANDARPDLRARLVSWHEVAAEEPPTGGYGDGFVDTAGRRYVGSIDGKRALVVASDGSETEFRFVEGAWHELRAGELGPPVLDGLAALLTRASLIARGGVPR